MKGGITSGGGLSPDHLQARDSLPTPAASGTSAGAIAAVMAAAAEYRRQNSKATPEAGYLDAGLVRYPLDVSKRLPSLFQASTGTRGIFDVLLAWMKDGWLAGLRQVVRSKRAWFWAGVAIVLLITLPGTSRHHRVPCPGHRMVADRSGGGFPLLPPAGGPVRCRRGRLRPRSPQGAAPPRLRADRRRHPSRRFRRTRSDGLAQHPDQPRRRQPTATSCLTLGDLWGKAGLTAWRDSLEKGGRRAAPIGEVRVCENVHLETMTTNLTLRRPFRLPFRQHDFPLERTRDEEALPRPRGGQDEGTFAPRVDAAPCHGPPRSTTSRVRDATLKGRLRPGPDALRSW